MIDLNELHCFLVDMDGTIFLSDRVISGAIELLGLFKEKNLQYYFFTNNPSKSKAFYAEKLGRLGFGNYLEEKIISSSDVTADYILNTYGSNPKAYIVGTEALVQHLENRGIIFTDNEIPDCLVVGFDTSLTYAKVDKAVDLLRKGVPFLATNIDAVCPLDGGAVLPDCGSICAMLTHASGRTPKFLGKPSPETAAYIQRITKVPANKTGVIGDRLYTDMRFAVDNGMCAIGVLSGEMTRDDIDKSGISLDYLFGSVLDLYEILKR